MSDRPTREEVARQAVPLLRALHERSAQRKAEAVSLDQHRPVASQSQPGDEEADTMNTPSEELAATLRKRMQEREDVIREAEIRQAKNVTLAQLGSMFCLEPEEVEFEDGEISDQGYWVGAVRLAGRVYRLAATGDGLFLHAPNHPNMQTLDELEVVLRNG